jgi:hypothetical protein
VQDIDELDKYPWSGHSAILGNRKNPLVPEIRDQGSEVSKQAVSPAHPKGLVCSDCDPSSRIRTNQPKTVFASLAPQFIPILSGRFKDKPLAEKTIEDVLLHFGETQTVARRRYREFVEKGIAQGRRPEFQGGGLVRSAGGNKAGLLGRSKEEREKGDARILGSGDFVMQALDKANETFERGFRPSISLDELTKRVIKDREVDLKELLSTKRTEKISNTRSIISYLAAIELKNSGKKIAEYLHLSEKSVSRCIDRGKKLLDNDEKLLDYIH